MHTFQNDAIEYCLKSFQQNEMKVPRLRSLAMMTLLMVNEAHFCEIRMRTRKYIKVRIQGTHTHVNYFDTVLCFFFLIGWYKVLDAMQKMKANETKKKTYWHTVNPHAESNGN